MSLFGKVKNWFASNNYRAENLKVVANQLNTTYSATDEFGMIRLLKDFKLFQKGFSKKKHQYPTRKRRIFSLRYSCF